MLQDYIRSYYENAVLRQPDGWNLSRKHVRVVLRNGVYMKLNKYRNRLNARSLKNLCVKLAPIHVYCSILDWLFPERMDKKTKANYAIPIGGEYVFDMDSTNVQVKHPHNRLRVVCPEYLSISKALTLHICEAIEENYSQIQIVFSGRRGFRIHVLDFNYRDQTYCHEGNLMKSHEVARFKYSLYLASTRYGFNQSHFIVASDPMRIISLPYSLNGEGELVCLPVGNRKKLERLRIESLLERASSYPYIDFHAHLEPHDAAARPLLATVGGG